MEKNQTEENSTLENENDNEKWIGASSYILFFLPLILSKESTFGKFHANQGLNLFILSVATSIIGRMVPIVGPLVIAPLVGLFCFVLAIMGIINAINGKEKPLPLIGGIRLIE